MNRYNDDPSRRPTAPQVQRPDTRATIQPGVRAEVNDARAPDNRRDEDPVSDMIDGFAPSDPAQRAMFRQLNRIARAQAGLATHLLKHDGEIAALQAGAPTRYVSPLPRSYDVGKPSMSTPPMANPDREGDVLIAMRDKMPSIPDGETDAEKITRLEKADREGNAKIGSLTEALDSLRLQVNAMQKAQPAAAVAAGESAAKILTNKNFMTAVATIATTVVTVFGAGVYQSHKQDQSAKQQTIEVERAAREAAKDGAREAKPEAPSVFIVRGESVEPIPSGAQLKGK